MKAKKEYPLVNETEVVTGLYSQGGSGKDNFITVLNRTPRLYDRQESGGISSKTKNFYPLGKAV